MNATQTDNDVLKTRNSNLVQDNLITLKRNDLAITSTQDNIIDTTHVRTLHRTHHTNAHTKMNYHTLTIRVADVTALLTNIQCAYRVADDTVKPGVVFDEVICRLDDRFNVPAILSQPEIQNS